MGIDTCTDMCIDMCMDTCIDMCTLKLDRVDVPINTCGLFVGLGLGLCVFVLKFVDE